MKNIKDLRDDLIDCLNKLKSGEIGIREAKEHANVAGKIMTSAKLQMEYNAFTKSVNRIDFYRAKRAQILLQREIKNLETPFP